jgi:hypothetical protein
MRCGSGAKIMAGAVVSRTPETGREQAMANGSFYVGSLRYHQPVFAASTMLCFFTVGVFSISLVCWLIASLTA